jgi:cytoskeletal protein CcmA (bactofilin family)
LAKRKATRRKKTDFYHRRRSCLQVWPSQLRRKSLASIVRISNGAQVEGAITAQELTIGGRFKGTIQANRVTLTSSAVVEGEIFHRSLAIEENAWFAGVSRPEEASASRVTDQLVPTDGNQHINGSLENEAHADTATVS